MPMGVSRLSATSLSTTHCQPWGVGEGGAAGGGGGLRSCAFGGQASRPWETTPKVQRRREGETSR